MCFLHHWTGKSIKKNCKNIDPVQILQIKGHILKFTISKLTGQNTMKYKDIWTISWFLSIWRDNYRNIPMEHYDNQNGTVLWMVFIIQVCWEWEKLKNIALDPDIYDILTINMGLVYRYHAYYRAHTTNYVSHTNTL